MIQINEIEFAAFVTMLRMDLEERFGHRFAIKVEEKRPSFVDTAVYNFMCLTKDERSNHSRHFTCRLSRKGEVQFIARNSGKFLETRQSVFDWIDSARKGRR